MYPLKDNYSVSIYFLNYSLFSILYSPVYLIVHSFSLILVHFTASKAASQCHVIVQIVCHDLEFLRSLWDRYLDLNPFYYLSTCALAEYQAKTKIENDLL